MLFTPIKPMLLSMGNELADDEDYIYEPKWDGWRILLHKKGDRIEAYTKNGNNVTYKFPELMHIASSIKSFEAILDCEGVCIRDNRPVFEDFQYRGKLTDSNKIRKAQDSHRAAFVIFDVLQTNRSHRDDPLIERKYRLQELIESSEYVLPTMFVEGHGKDLHQMMIEKDWEGTVKKHKGSRWIEGVRTTEWKKHKIFKTIDTVILGYRTEPNFSLVVGVNFETVKNKPVAIVQFGIKPEEKFAFLNIAKQIHTKKERNTQWIEPLLSCSIQYLEKTERHHLRITSFKGFLFDKNPHDCKWVS